MATKIELIKKTRPPKIELIEKKHEIEKARKKGVGLLIWILIILLILTIFELIVGLV
jgi:hypothetical protein